METPGLDCREFGIDLVAEQRDEGCCAVQGKCYSPRTVISKKDLDLSISASARDPLVSRTVADTNDEWGPSAQRTTNGPDRG